ncbi:MAG: hypothetical protein V3T88_07905 [Nitrosomonadaceae bacterium]
MEAKEEIQVKQDLDLTKAVETLLPLKQLKPYLNDEGNSIAFEEGNSLMILVIHNDGLFKKRVNRKYFKPDIEGTVQ